MNNDRFTKFHMKNKNNYESKRINEDKNKNKYKEKPINNINKEKIIYGERNIINQNNDIYKSDKFKSEFNNDKDKLKEKKLNKNINLMNKTNPLPHNYDKLLKLKFNVKTLNPNIKKSIITNTKNYNYNIYSHTNQINPSNQISKELNNMPINNNYNYCYNEKYLTVNQNDMKNKICGNKKLKNNKYKPINNNIQNSRIIKNLQYTQNDNNKIFRTIEPNLNDDIYDYNKMEKTIYKKVNKKEDNIELINNDKYNNNERDIKINNFTKNNFHKNNSSSSIYCSPNKINLMDNKRTIDDKNFNIYNNIEKIKSKKNYIYKKSERNASCIKSREPLKKLEKEFESDENDFKASNKSISKNKYIQLSFNSPVSSYDKKEERNSVSYLNSNKRISIQNNNIYNQNNYFEVSELFNRNDREKSKYTTIQNSEDEIKSNCTTVKNSDKKYYYQTLQDNNYNYDIINSYNNENLLNKNKTFKRKNNTKNNIIYENNVNSFDKNYDNEYYDNEDDYKLSSSNYNYKNNYNSKTPSINNDLYKNDSDFINFERQRNDFSNKVTNYNNNSKIIKNISKKTKINNSSIGEKKFANSFNNEFTCKENYNNFNNRTKLNNNKPKNYQKLILDRRLNPNYNLYSNDNDEFDENISCCQYKCNVKTDNNSVFIKSKKNITGKSPQKYIINDNSPRPTILIDNEGIYDNYLYNNSKTREDFYKDSRKIDSKIISIKDKSIESSPKTIKKSLYHKKNSQNHFSMNNPGILNDINVFNKTCYIKKQIDKKNIYQKKKLKNKINDFSTTTVNKTLKKEQTDNYSINSSHNSKNINSISNNANTNINTFSNKKSNNISISVEESIIKNDFLYSLADIKDKIIINNHYINHKLYNFGIKKPLTKLCYIDKNKKYQRKDKKGANISINISNISENKHNDNNSFSISFNNNKNKIKKNSIKETDKEKEFTNEDILLDEKNINSDYDSKNLEDNFKKISGIKKAENDFIYNDCINFESSEEKDEKIHFESPKKENCLPKKDANNFNDNFVQSEDEDNDKIRLKKSLKINLEKTNNNKIKSNGLYNNYLSNSTSKKENNHLLKNEKLTKINIEKMSLFTKKISDVLFKSQKVEDETAINMNKNKKNFNQSNKIINENILINNNNIDNADKQYKKDDEEKKRKIRKSLTEKEFVLGYFKLNDIFTKKSYNAKDRNTITFNNNLTQFIGNRIEEEMIDYELNDDIKMKQKLYTYKIKPKNKLLEDEEILNYEKDENKIYNIKSILLLRNKSLSIKDNLLSEKIKKHINNLLHPEVKVYKIKESNENNADDIMHLLNELNENNINYISEQILNEFIDKINIIISAIFDKIINAKSKINISAKLCNNINELSIKNNKEKINLGNIIMNEYTKRLKDNINNSANLTTFIMEIISYELISFEEGFNLCLNLYDIYEKNKKYIILEKCINLYEFFFTKFTKNHKIEDNNSNLDLIADIENKLKNCVSKDKDLDKNLKDKIATMIKKRKIFLNEKENNNKTKTKELNKINIINNKKNFKENSKDNNLNESGKNHERSYIKQIQKENKNENSNKIVNKNININENNTKEKNPKESKLISMDAKEEIQNNNKYSKTNSNFYTTYPKLISNKQTNIKDNNSNDQDELNINANNLDDLLNNDIIQNDNNGIKNSYTVTHKKKSKKKSKSSEKRIIPKSNELCNNINEENKEEIKKDYEKYMAFLKKEGIEKKEDIYDELNDLYNWKIIDKLIKDKKVKLEDIIKIYIYDICKNIKVDKNQMTNSEIFKSNEYIKTIIEYYSSNLSKNQIEILHLNMIEIFMDIDAILKNENNVDNDSSFMYKIMGNLLFVLLKNKLYYMKDLNNFIDKSRETQINVAKVVKYCVISAGNNVKQYHNDFKFTKLFNNNDIFNLYVTKEIFESKK